MYCFIRDIRKLTKDHSPKKFVGYKDDKLVLWNSLIFNLTEIKEDSGIIISLTKVNRDTVATLTKYNETYTVNIRDLKTLKSYVLTSKIVPWTASLNCSSITALSSRLLVFVAGGTIEFWDIILNQKIRSYSPNFPVNRNVRNLIFKVKKISSTRILTIQKRFSAYVWDVDGTNFEIPNCNPAGPVPIIEIIGSKGLAWIQKCEDTFGLAYYDIANGLTIESQKKYASKFLLTISNNLLIAHSTGKKEVSYEVSYEVGYEVGYEVWNPITLSSIQMTKEEIGFNVCDTCIVSGLFILSGYCNDRKCYLSIWNDRFIVFKTELSNLCIGLKPLSDSKFISVHINGDIIIWNLKGEKIKEFKVDYDMKKSITRNIIVLSPNKFIVRWHNTADFFDLLLNTTSKINYYYNTRLLIF